jgi:hypothetical protein
MDGGVETGITVGVVTVGVEVRFDKHSTHNRTYLLHVHTSSSSSAHSCVLTVLACFV